MLETNTCLVKLEETKTTIGKCISCSKEGKIFLPYGPQHFCEKHFIQLIEKRVKKTIRDHKLIQKGDHLVVGVSGGKDSLVTLYILNKYFSKTNKITALMIDEGIEGYRDMAINAGIDACNEWGIDYRVETYKKNYNNTMRKIHDTMLITKENGAPCSYCGVLRRKLLNKYARELGADKMATGHNMDDEAQSILMNIFDNNLFGFKRLGPRAGIKDSDAFVARIKPLYNIPENEVLLFASFLGIKHYSHECCPFSGPAKRNEFRSSLDRFETRFPGTKHSILKFFLGLKVELKKEKNLGQVKLCERCSEPAKQDLCKACEKIEQITI